MISEGKDGENWLRKREMFGGGNGRPDAGTFYCNAVLHFKPLCLKCTEYSQITHCMKSCIKQCNVLCMKYWQKGTV